SALLVEALELRAGPDLAFAGREPHGAIERLHRRVREVREAVLGLDDRGGALHAGVDVAGGGRLHARLARQAGELARELVRVERGAGAEVPVDLQRVAAELGGPEVLGDDRDPRR